MTEWRYFLSAHGEEERELQELAERGRAGLYRLPAGADVAFLEALVRRGRYGWMQSDLMLRVRYRGSEYEFLEISPERAQEILTMWVDEGIVPGYPPDEPLSPLGSPDTWPASTNQPDDATSMARSAPRSSPVGRWTALWRRYRSR